jgi:hypothetical protein
MSPRRYLVVGCLIAAAFIAGHWLSSVPGQDVKRAPPSPAMQGRFEFEVIETYDSKYLGDTPGLIGRHGELGDFRPQAALGDPIFRGTEKVGKVSGLRWSQGTGSLEIEFDPEPFTRVALGDVVWIKLGGAPDKEPAGAEPPKIPAKAP